MVKIKNVIMNVVWIMGITIIKIIKNGIDVKMKFIIVLIIVFIWTNQGIVQKNVCYFLTMMEIVNVIQLSIYVKLNVQKKIVKNFVIYLMNIKKNYIIAKDSINVIKIVF